MSETVYKGRNSPFLVTIETVAGVPYTATQMATITRCRLKINGAYADSDVTATAFNWTTYAAYGQLIVDVGLIDFTAGTDNNAELIVYDADYTSGRVVKVLEITIDESVNGDGTLAGALTGITLTALSADPDSPADGSCAIWLSDGTDSGDAGDLMIMVTVGETTKTAILLDYSGA